MDNQHRQRTLVFCTAYARNTDVWQERYQRWLDCMALNGVMFDQLLIIDDGSPCLPDWPNVQIVLEGASPTDAPTTVLYHFLDRLGRGSVRDYPGWFRSFCFAAKYAEQNGFSKIIHIESDAFVISRRFARFLNDVSEGWIGLKLPRHQMPESAIQVIAGNAMQQYVEFAGRPYYEFIGKDVESCIPYNLVVKQFKGDRYGQLQSFVPRDADWSVQVYPTEISNPEYFWWINESSNRPEDKDSVVLAPNLFRDLNSGINHNGISFVKVITDLVRFTGAENFVQIGSGLGASTSGIDADLLCVAPRIENFVATAFERERTLLFQMPPERFFSQINLRMLFTLGVDIAFIDSNHLIEILLKEFTAIEQNCRSKSLIILHDCLPTNIRMAERNFRLCTDEAPATRDFWTGDIWKVLPILKSYRPDIDVILVDAPPTGLVICTNLNASSTVFADCANEITNEYSKMTLGQFGLEKLWSLYPMLDSKRAFDDPASLVSHFPMY